MSAADVGDSGAGAGSDSRDIDDRDIDDRLAELRRASGEPLEVLIDTAERLHSALQQRLATPDAL